MSDGIHRLGRATEAVPLAQELTAADPWRGEGWRLLGVALWSSSRSTEALEALRDIGGDSPTNSDWTRSPRWWNWSARSSPNGRTSSRHRSGTGPGCAPRSYRARRTPSPREAELAALAGTGPLTVITGVLAGRRVLLLLDNAHDSAQVRPLLPGEPGCTVVVTGRTRLDGPAVTEGARALPLDAIATSISAVADGAQQTMIGAEANQLAANDLARMSADLMRVVARFRLDEPDPQNVA